MKKKGIQAYLFSIAGVAAMLGIIIAVNMIASRAKVRVDLTADQAYTLSKGTKAILAKLDTPVQIRFYFTRNDNRIPIPFKNYAQTVEDLLGEYSQVSKGLVEVQILNPEPDSDAEDSAKLDGVEGQRISQFESVYFGMSISMLDQKEVIPFLSPAEAPQLEYQISRAISRVAAPQKQTIGLMSPLPFSGQMSPMMRQRQGAAPPWFLYSDLQRTYNVKVVDMNAESIPDDVKVLLVIHPKGISDATQYAIDQFVLRGGKLIAMVDPVSAMDRQAAMTGATGPSSSNLERLFKAWGFTMDATKLVADLDYVYTGQTGPMPAALNMNENAVNKSDILVSGADRLFFVYAGALTGSPVQGLQQTVLVKSSKNSQLVDPTTAQMGEQLIKEFAASGVEYTLAMRLTGKFPTAFPGGKPQAAPKPDEKPEDKKPEPAGLKESAVEGNVLIFSDSDFVQDELAFEELGGGRGQRMLMARNSNMAVALSAIDQLAGDENLIAIRGRSNRERPFTVVNKMLAEAEARYRDKFRELDESLAQTQSRLMELQQVKTGDTTQRLVASPEQKAEIEKFKKKEAETKQMQKQERKNLNSAIESLKNRVSWINIGLMPALVILAGIVLAVIRRRRQAAV